MMSSRGQFSECILIVWTRCTDILAGTVLCGSLYVEYLLPCLLFALDMISTFLKLRPCLNIATGGVKFRALLPKSQTRYNRKECR